MILQISPEKMKSIKTIAMALLAFFALIELLVLLVIQPRMQISQVHLDSEIHIDDDLFYEISGLGVNSSYLHLDEDWLEEELMRIPQAGQVEVRKRFPNGLDVSIKARQSIALLWEEDLPNQGLFAVDLNGVIYPNHLGVSEWDLPVISGVDLSLLVPGDSIDESYILLLQDLDRMQEQFPSYYKIISEIKIIPQPGEGYSLLVFLTTHRIAARCTLPLNKAKLEKAILVLDVMEAQGMAGEVDEVDIRRASVSYWSREA